MRETLLTPKEVAVILKVSVRTAYRIIRERIGFVRVAQRLVRVDPAALRRYRGEDDPAPSVVYFIQAGVGGHIKIGVTTDVRERLSRLQMASPVDLQLLGAVAGDRYFEASLHDRFHHLHVRGEWFRAERELLDYIATETRP